MLEDRPQDPPPPTIEERVAGITTIELLEEVDRRLCDALYDDHRGPAYNVKAEGLANQTALHFMASLCHLRDAVHNYNHARALENDRQTTRDFDKEESYS